METRQDAGGVDVWEAAGTIPEAAGQRFYGSVRFVGKQTVAVSAVLQNTPPAGSTSGHVTAPPPRTGRAEARIFEP